MAIRMIMERKIAPSYLYLNQRKPESLKLLNEIFYIPRSHPDVEEFNDYLAIQCAGRDSGDTKGLITHAKSFASDTYGVVEELYYHDLATNRNLSMLFGNGAIVSNILYELKAEEEDEHGCTQKFLSDMWNNKEKWREGCTVFDLQYGLKLHYLTNDERKAEFGEIITKVKDKAERIISHHFQEYDDSEDGRLESLDRVIVSRRLVGM